MENFKIYNQDCTEELLLENLDFSKGYLVDKEEIIFHEEEKGIEEKGHFETIREYPNGGKDVEWIVDEPKVPYKPAWEEKIMYQIYMPFSSLELEKIEKEKELNYALAQLANSDYQAIKYAEGWFSEEEYAPIKELRESYREKIRECQKRLLEINSQGAE